MTVDDVVKEIDRRLQEEPFELDDYEAGYDAALKWLREWITGDFGNVN